MGQRNRRRTMNIKNREQFLMVLTAIAFAILLGNWIVFEPLSKLWKARSDAITQLREQVKNGRMMVRRRVPSAIVGARCRSTRCRAPPRRRNCECPRHLTAGPRPAASILTASPHSGRMTRLIIRRSIVAWTPSGNLQTLTRFLYQIESDPANGGPNPIHRIDGPR